MKADGNIYTFALQVSPVKSLSVANARREVIVQMYTALVNTVYNLEVQCLVWRFLLYMSTHYYIMLYFKISVAPFRRLSLQWRTVEAGDTVTPTGSTLFGRSCMPVRRCSCNLAYHNLTT